VIVPVTFISQTFKIFLREFVDDRDNEMGVLYHLFFPPFFSVISTCRVQPHNHAALTRQYCHYLSKSYLKALVIGGLNEGVAMCFMLSPCDILTHFPSISANARSRKLTRCGRVKQICVFNKVKLGTSASSP
jgi:hypothetical protein